MTDDEKIQVYLCHDHFERLVNGDVCANCPSNAENKEAIKALSKMYSDEPEAMQVAVLAEMRSVRRSQQLLRKDISEVRDSVNGKGGLAARVTALEVAVGDIKSATGRTERMGLLYFVLSTSLAALANLLAIVL